MLSSKIRLTKRIWRLIGSHSFFIAVVCLVAYIGSFRAVAAGKLTPHDAIMFNAGAWSVQKRRVALWRGLPFFPELIPFFLRLLGSSGSGDHFFSFEDFVHRIE